jgi:hypothetical protein
MRISTTTIESFRLFMQPEQDWMSEDALLATIRGEFRTTPQIELGIAFERVLENPDKYRVRGGYACNGLSFDDATMREPLALIDRRGLFQVKSTKAYGDCTVVAKADTIVGAHIGEWKTTASTFDADKYLQSCQWRYELDIFGAPQLTYHVFCLDDHGNGVVALKDIHSFNVFAYPDLHQDCCNLLHRFVTYVQLRGLDALLRERQRAAEAA